jgi:HSP20 family protein
MSLKSNAEPVYELHRYLEPNDATWPRIEVRESPSAFEVLAELPGLEQRNVDVRFADGVLILKGSGLRRDGWAQAFERRIPLDRELDDERMHVALRHGVLSVALAKKPAAMRRLGRVMIN